MPQSVLIRLPLFCKYFMSKFSEGAQVAIKSDNLTLGLTAGDTGRVWALYHSEPAAYEVTFCAQSGEEFDALMYEDELMEPAEWELSASRPERSLASA